MSGLGGNVIFSASIKDRALSFCVHIPLVYEHLFYKYFVRRSTKGKRASLTVDVVNLVSLVLVYKYSTHTHTHIYSTHKHTHNALNCKILELDVSLLQSIEITKFDFIRLIILLQIQYSSSLCSIPLNCHFL